MKRRRMVMAIAPKISMASTIAYAMIALRVSRAAARCGSSIGDRPCPVLSVGFVFKRPRTVERFEGNPRCRCGAWSALFPREFSFKPVPTLANYDRHR
jgi:hypothetical protein